jgi:hypothetical protein
MNVIVPKAWILENIDTAIDLLPPNPGSYRAFGGFNAKQTSDGANSVSKAHRDGGYMSFISHSYIGDEFFTDLFPLMFDTSDLSNFPGFIGSNHAGPNNMGPLKSDWTKACPLDWTPKERDEKCKILCVFFFSSKQELVFRSSPCESHWLYPPTQSKAFLSKKQFTVLKC